MTSTAASYGKQLLREGNVLCFTVRNTVKLQDGLEYMILEDPYNQKHFIEAGLYAGYDMKAGQLIECRVDKINCTGRVFLEPLHPYYSAGNNYDFRIVQVGFSEGKKILVLEDVFQNQLELLYPPENSVRYFPGKMLRCKIIRIRKGKPEVDIVK